MFSTIYNTAKRILSRSPSVQDRSSELGETPPTSHHIEVTMVTTRRGTETPGQDPAVTPRSSGKRKALKRELEALDTPTAAKRQKTSTPKKKVVEEQQQPDVEEQALPDSAEDTSDTINVAVTDDKAPTQAEKLPIRRRSSPMVIVAKLSPPIGTEAEGAADAITEGAPASTQDTEFHTPERQSESVYATPATQKKAAKSLTPRATRASERTSSAKKSSGRKNTAPVEQQDESVDTTTPTQDAPAKKAHMRFGSKDPEEPPQKIINLQGHKRYEAPTPAKPEIADTDDDASDSDEAPEVVTTSAAASKAKASQQDAARAQLAQQEKERAKREAREQRIAEEQAEKRKREEKKAQKLAKQLAKQQPEPSIEAKTPSTSIDLAGLLPTSLLSSLPDQRAPTPPPVRGGKTDEELRKEKLRHHIKFLERTDKGIKDVKKGKLSVAVLGQQNRVLPPKVNRATKNVREKWLKGREVKKNGPKGIGGKMERKAFGNRGFLKGDD